MDVLISVNEEFVPGEKPEEIAVLGNTASAVEKTDSLGKVLVVDDSRMSRSILRAILEKAGYSVSREAANGEEAVEAFKECGPDLVTLDITMPKMDGLEALKQILAIDGSARVIMITAAGQQDKLIGALKAGAKRFISKPFNEAEILKNVQDVLSGRE
ncbi:MAG: response regulator [Butyrivibrio sp.]|nr:response regulator [Butyrivibrio sp.]